MPVKYGKWSVEDVEYLKTNYPATGLSEMSKKLNRSVKSTDYKIRRLELPRKGCNNTDIGIHRLEKGAIIGSWRLDKMGAGRYRPGWLCKCLRCEDESIVSIASLEEGAGSRCKRCLRLEKGEAGLNRLIEGYITNSRVHDRCFSLTKEEFKILTSGNCHYCGIEPYRHVHRKIKNKWGDYVYNGIDRLNTELGYIPGNCISCCWPCNRMRGTMSYRDFYNHIRKIYRHLTRMANNGKNNKSRS